MAMLVLSLIPAALALVAALTQSPFLNVAESVHKNFTPLRPPAVPLAVRSPYLSTWTSTHEKETLDGHWPIFWTGAEVGWSGLIHVDNTTYEWMGYASSALPNIEPVTTELIQYTATKTAYTLSAGPVGLNVTFLTPVTLDDFRRQSLPASYLSLSFWSLDQRNHSVNLYSDTDGSWVSGDANSRIQWSMGLNARKREGEDHIVSHIVEKGTQGRFSEWADRAEWGQLLWSTAMVLLIILQAS